VDQKYRGRSGSAERISKPDTNITERLPQKREDSSRANHEAGCMEEKAAKSRETPKQLGVIASFVVVRYSITKALAR
jgi:hypothetical protein